MRGWSWCDRGAASSPENRARRRPTPRNRLAPARTHTDLGAVLGDRILDQHRFALREWLESAFDGGALGGPDRRQALPPPRRRRRTPDLQPARPRRRPRTDALRLRRRAGLPLRGAAETPRQLGSHGRRRRTDARNRRQLRPSAARVGLKDRESDGWRPDADRGCASPGVAVVAAWRGV